MNPLLDTVEPDWYGNANSLSEKHTALVAKWKGNGTLGLYSRETVESLLAECRKQARKEALLEAAQACDNRSEWVSNGKGIQYPSNSPTSREAGFCADELRRMAEGEE